MKHKEVLKKLETKEKFGFLYNGYKKEYYFWEIVIMYRKIMVITIAVLLFAQGAIAQALMAIALLIVFLALNLKMRPFTLNQLNDLETFSIITQIITLYCGLFFISDVSTILENAG